MASAARLQQTCAYLKVGTARYRPLHKPVQDLLVGACWPRSCLELLNVHVSTDDADEQRWRPREVVHGLGDRGALPAVREGVRLDP
eukprot:4010265-Pleurochrysis_carterae.AAC.1